MTAARRALSASGAIGAATLNATESNKGKAMTALRNRRHEKFAQEVAAGTELPRAYEIAGFKPSSVGGRNYNRVAKRPDVAARIAEIKRNRLADALAARMPPLQVLDTLRARGVDRLEDFFERDAAGILSVRPDLRAVPPEVALALVRFLSEGFGFPGIKFELPAVCIE